MMELVPDLDKPGRVIVAFSGGKDSIATWLYLTELGWDVKCLFADTGWESDETYKYLDLLESSHKINLIRVYPEVRDIFEIDSPVKSKYKDIWFNIINMKSLTLLKGRPPGPTARFCTTVLKLRPSARWVRSNSCDIDIVACGVRAEESHKRREMPVFTYDDLMKKYRWMPIHSWSHKDVFEIAKRHNIPPNPLYLKGCARVGCWPCIFARKSEILVMTRDKDAVERLINLEESSGRTFFAPGKTPKKFHSKTDVKTGKSINTAEDVIRWATSDIEYKSKQTTENTDDIESEMCLSVYGLCE